MRDPEDSVDSADAEEAQLWECLRTGNAEEASAAREQLVVRYLWLARSIALRALRERSSNADLDRHDLIQLATVGLIESIDRYDPERGIPFSAFARKRVHGAVLNGIEQSSEYRAQASWMHRTTKERTESIAATTSSESDRLARLAEVTVGLAIGFMLEDSGMYVSAPEQVGTPYDVNELVVLQQQVRSIVTSLPTAQRRVLELHYFGDLSFSEVGKIVGVTKARISQVHGSAIVEIRRRLRLIGSADSRG